METVAMTRIRSFAARHMGVALFALLMAAGVLTPASASAASRRQISDWIRQLASRDPVRSSSAAASLLASDDKRALKALMEALEPGQVDSVRISVITAFETNGDDRATQQLISTIEDKSEVVRKAAIAALQSINTPTAVTLLEEAAIDKERPPQTRSQIIVILGEMRTIDAISTLIGLLSDREETVRKAAQAALERITLQSCDSVAEWQAWWRRSHEELSREDMLEELVTLQSERIRNMSQLIEKLYVKVLEERPDRNDPSPLIDALSESNQPKVQIYAIKQIVAIKDLAAPQSTTVTTALLAALDYPDASVRQAVATALATHGNANVIEPLIKALGDPIASVRVAAAKSLGQLNALSKPAINPLCELLKGESEEVAAAAAQALGEMGHPSAVDPLIAAVRTPTAPPKLYEAAAAALVKIGDKRAIPVFVHLLKSTTDVVRQDAVAALGQLRVTEAAKDIADVAFNDPKPPIRVAAIAALAKIGGPIALDATIAALADEEKPVADQALLSLVQLADVRPAPYETALGRLLNERKYDLAELVLAQAIEQFTTTPNHVGDIALLRWTMAQNLTRAREWNLARPHLEALVSSEPRNMTYVIALSEALLELRDYTSALALYAQTRSGNGNAETAWQETLKITRRVASDKTASPQRIIDIVDALEKEDAAMGGEATAAALGELRENARRMQQPAGG